MAEGILPFKDLGKQELLERCRKLEFVDDVEDLRCTRCNRLALEHWYTNCGHSLCPNCKRLLSGGRCRCPHCGQFILRIEQSADFEEKVNGLQAKCPNSRYGCPLVTTVKLLQGHLVGCNWTKERVLPAVYRGANTMQILLEEVSSLKEQMGNMNGIIGFLSNELRKRQEVEEEIKNSVEMSVEDIKSHLNGLSSDLHYEATSLKMQFKDFDQIKMKDLLDLKNTLTLDIKNKITALEKAINEINHEKFKDHFVSKDEMMQLQETMAEMKVGNKLIIQMLDQKEERFSQKLTKAVESMDAKVMTSESRMEAALTNNKQEIVAISKELQGKVEKSNEELKAQWQKQSSGLNQRLEQHETNFNQKLSNEVKQLNEKINRNKTAVEMNKKENNAEMKAIKSETKKQEVDLKGQIATNVKNMQEKILSSVEVLKQKLVEVHSDVTQGLQQEQLRCNQKLADEIKALEEKMRSKEEGIDTKMNTEFQKLEVAVEKYRKEIKSELKLGKQKVEHIVKGSLEKYNEEFNTQFKQLSSQVSHDIEKETKKLSQEIDQLDKKTSEIKNIIDGTIKSLQVDYKTQAEAIQQMNPQQKQIEAFQRGIAIEQLLNRKSSIQQLVDSFLFGSAQEQMVFESLCLKWTTKHRDLVKRGRREHVSDIFPVYGFQLKAQLKLTIDSNGAILLHLCFFDEAREGQEVDIKPLPMVTYIINDLSGQNKHLIKDCYYSFNDSLKYNEFGYLSDWIEKSEWTALVSPGAVSLEVLFLVELMTIMNKPLSVDGSMMDTIEHYSKKLQMAKEGLIQYHWSPPFLTHVGGYRVAVWMGLNGWNEGRLAAGIWFLSGECDSQLGSEFAHETSVTLINQWDAMKNITVKKQGWETSVYGMEIATHDALGSGGFLVNDSFTYHVTVKPIK